jgi:hypothetical protein
MAIDIKLGKIVFVLSKKTQTIVPVIVREKNVCESLEGLRTTYKVLIGEPNKAKLVDLSKLEGAEVFGSTEEVKKYLIDRFEALLVEECKKATEKAKAWYGHLMPIQSENNLLEELTGGGNESSSEDDFLQEMEQDPILEGLDQTEEIHLRQADGTYQTISKNGLVT